jgi:hypothetical protein
MLREGVLSYSESKPEGLMGALKKIHQFMFSLRLRVDGTLVLSVGLQTQNERETGERDSSHYVCSHRRCYDRDHI